ncbi:MAG: serine/threonine-protein kinase, partial [Myxococcota bacterium]|nr:serine/threonine-protein kinase [Myxococcota bacterium]
MSAQSTTSKSELIFEKYELIRQIAVGGMGEIFLARQSGVAGFDRLAILKTLRSKVASDPEVIADFLDEARIAATLNHPNIVSIYEIGAWQGVYILAMEFIRGVPLSHFLREEHRARSHVPYPIAARFIRDAALGLAHAHQAKNIQGENLNIIHRDISPQNIMIRDDGVVKVVDFGIAKATNRAQRTQAGFVKGKLSYMSPEQLVGEPLSPQSDQFALGILLWEMSTGRRYTPSGINQAELLQRVVEEPMIPISHVQSDVPEQFDAIVQKMTANKPADRYDDCTAIAEALDDFIENQETRLREKNVVDYIEDLAGDAIRDVVHNLEPADKNLIAVLKPDFEQGTVIHYSTDHAKLKSTKDFKTSTVALAATLCVLMIVGVLYLIKQ